MLDLFLYWNQYQLATLDAVYSDGTRYRPLVKAFREIRNSLPRVRSVLVLGTGLGSAMQILGSKNFFPAYTLVDSDELVLKWALELLPSMGGDQMTSVCMDASDFIAQHDDKYDIVIADIFKSRVVPAFVTETAFLEKCRSRLNAGGTFILNYIVNDCSEWKKMMQSIDAVFPGSQVHHLGINRIIIATA